jgi:23S rRNA (uracil1939-C5)-methyltransferase
MTQRLSRRVHECLPAAPAAASHYPAANMPAPVKSRDVIDVTIDSLAQGGRGVARLDNFVLFVNRALPGDRVRARVNKVRRSFGEATMIELLEAGPQTVTPPCPYVGTCGGCAWQRLDYQAQLQAKQEQVRDAIVRLGGVEDPPLDPIIGADDTFGYRNKVEYTFSTAEDGTVQLGYHVAGRWDQLIGVEMCLIADPRGHAVRDIVQAWANEHGLIVYDRDEGKGLLRNLVVRVGYNTGEVQAHLITGPVKKALPKLAELVDDLEAGVPGLVGVLHSTTDSSADVAAGDEPPAVLWGRDWFTETLAGKSLRVTPSSFLQTNTAMAEKLYARVREVAQLRADDIAYDLYCGIGSITMLLAAEVDSVVGVEVVAEAIECAKQNAEANGIDNIDFQVGNVRPVLKFAKGVWPDPTLIVVDPPRSGLVPKVVRRICEAQPERIVYVSCNPTTFAGNLPQFREHGYELTYVQPVDQFPHTHHVELVARLEPIPGWEPDPPAESQTNA